MKIQLLTFTQRLLAQLVLLSSLVSGVLTTAADSPAASKAVAPGPSIASRIADFNDGTSDGAPVSPGVQLAQQHLAELLPLLAHLRDHAPEQYARAIRDLDRAAKRLQALQRRDASLYELALREWQARGHRDLLKARLRVHRSEADAQQLLVQMQQLREIELQRLGRERELLAEREALMRQRAGQARQAAERARRQIEQIDQQIQRLTARPNPPSGPTKKPRASQ